MTQAETNIRTQWEDAAPGWAKWEDTMARAVEAAGNAMLDMAGVVPGARVLDVACGAGSQTLLAARRVGPEGHVLAADISEKMLEHLTESVRAARLDNVSTILGAAEDLDLPPASFDAAISRLGLMLFAEPGHALTSVKTALKPRGKIAVVVFTVPEANPFMAKPMRILLRHTGKQPPAPGQPGIFSLGSPGVLERLFGAAGYVDYEERTVPGLLRMTSAADALTMMQEAFGAYRAVLSDSPEPVRKAAWAEVGETLQSFETGSGFAAPAEFLVGAGRKSS